MTIDPTTATILGSTLTGLAISILNYLRESRAHRWAVEQSERDKKERLATAEELKRQHEQAAMAITLNTQHAAAVLSDKIDQTQAKIDENTQLSMKAFTEANNINEKIAAIGEARLRGTAADRR